MNRFFKASVLILSLSFSLSLKAQLAHETPLGWQFGLNFGYYAPSKYTANYYNGSETNVNNARFVMSNYYWYQEIFQKLLAADTVFISGLPSNMHYKIALMPGLYGQFTFNENYAV